MTLGRGGRGRLRLWKSVFNAPSTPGRYRSHFLFIVHHPSSSSSLASTVADENQFQSLLFGQAGLDGSEHTLVLRNADTTQQPSYVDVDYIVITNGNADAQYVDFIVLDTLSHVQERSIDNSPAGHCPWTRYGTMIIRVLSIHQAGTTRPTV